MDSELAPDIGYRSGSGKAEESVGSGNGLDSSTNNDD